MAVKKNTFWKALEENDLVELEEFLSAGTDPDQVSKAGFPALFYAADNNRVEAVQLLLKYRAAPDTAEKYGDKTPLMTAVQQRYNDVARILIGAGADVNARCRFGRTPLMHLLDDFGDYIGFDMLLAAGAEIDAVDESGYTALMTAVKKDKDYFVKRLLELGADLNRTTRYNDTALDLAVRHGHDEIIDLLLKQGAECRSEQEKLEIYLNRPMLKLSGSYRLRRKNDNIIFKGQLLIAGGKRSIVLLDCSNQKKIKKLDEITREIIFDFALAGSFIFVACSQGVEVYSFAENKFKLIAQYKKYKNIDYISSDEKNVYLVISHKNKLQYNHDEQHFLIRLDFTGKKLIEKDKLLIAHDQGDSHQEKWLFKPIAINAHVYVLENISFRFYEEWWQRGKLKIIGGKNNKLEIIGETAEKIEMLEKSKYENFNDLALYKDFIYLACDKGLAVVNVKKKNKPDIINIIEMENALKISLWYPYLYLLTFNEVLVYKIENLQDPVFYSRLKIEKVASISACDGGLYLIQKNSQLRKYNLDIK